MCMGVLYTTHVPSFFFVLQVTINWARESGNKDGTIHCMHVICIVSGAYHYSLPCDIDLDTEVSKIEQSAPFLVWTGTAEDENAQFYVCCEQSVLTESKTVRDVIIDLMATYYVFDIVYQSNNAFFPAYCFKLQDKQVLPATTSKLVSNLSKLS